MSPRSRTREPLQMLIRRLHAHRPPVLLNGALLHALRDFAADCYARGADDERDVHRRSTLPAPGDPGDTGPYSITIIQPEED